MGSRPFRQPGRLPREIPGSAHRSHDRDALSAGLGVEWIFTADHHAGSSWCSRHPVPPFGVDPMGVAAHRRRGRMLLQGWSFDTGRGARCAQVPQHRREALARRYSCAGARVEAPSLSGSRPDSRRTPGGSGTARRAKTGAEGSGLSVAAAGETRAVRGSRVPREARGVRVTAGPSRCRIDGRRNAGVGPWTVSAGRPRGVRLRYPAVVGSVRPGQSGMPSASR